MDKNSLAHTHWECKYNIVFAPKYRRKIRSIAFPAISTGYRGFPIEKASVIALSAVRKFIGEYYGELDKIQFAFANKETFYQYVKMMQTYPKNAIENKDGVFSICI